VFFRERGGAVREYGLYIHIPFCKSRCRYCDFYTRPGSRAVPEGYIAALLRAFARYAPRSAAGRPLPPATVYFGGGTPGLLEAEQAERLLRAVKPPPAAEVTLEANPETAGAEKLAGFFKAGVNRLSLGVQTADGPHLALLGRRHTADMARQALKNARAAGFINISGDIMLALPGYSNREFDETLALLREGGALHISAYLLKLEENTAFGKTPPDHLPDADAAADFYLYALRRMGEAGYAQYEISNFAKPGFEGRHNLIYWNGGNWLGLGPAAHSCLEGRRFYFSRNLETFMKTGLPALPQSELTAQDYMMLRLRLNEGLDENAMRERFGTGLTERQRAVFGRLRQSGHAARAAGGWALTPKGMLVQNAVLAELFAG
jgi:oxygen-independent coproporphyrinogen-3 oxidase